MMVSIGNIKWGLAIKSLLDTMSMEYIYITSMYLPPLSTTKYCVPSSDIENPLSAPFSFSVGRYWQYMDAASGSSAINNWLSLIPA